MPLTPITVPLLTTVETVRVCAPTIVEAALGKVEREVCDRRLEDWAETAVRLARIDLTRSGLEHIREGQTYIVMSNHQSTYDIFVMMHVFPRTLRMVSKIEMFRIPILGQAMYAAEFVALDRADHSKARAGLDFAKDKLQSGVNVWIAPEGTRSPTGELLPFKKGGFMMSLQTGVPVLPATIVGTRDVLRSKGVRVHTGQKVSVQFHAPVHPNDFGHDGREEFMNVVQGRIASGLPEPLRPRAR
ncbi:MAG: lysophospholipid acyltransferase family protein [Polyangiales bacterium]